MKHFAFDLDGTLLESSGTIHKSTLAALKHIGKFHDIPKFEMDKRIGAHFEDIFNELEFENIDIDRFLNIFTKIYFDFLYDSHLYSKVTDILDELRARGVLVSLVTTKAQFQAERLLLEFGIYDKFDYIMGRRKDINHKPAPDPLLLLCTELDVPLDETIIIGDTELDIQCGKSAGTKTCYVTYGYGNNDTIQRENPDYIIDSTDELLKLIKNLI